MTDAILAREPAIRLGFFAGIFVALALWEIVGPRRSLSLPRAARWPGNLGLAALNTVMLRGALPLTAVALAQLGQRRAWGLLNNIGSPGLTAALLSVVLLDLATYLQHVMFHAVPALWRLHRVHHADLDFDVTTGIRFHPLEMLVSAGIRLATIAALGAPALGVLTFEVLLNATSMFNHGNVRIPQSIDRVLRWFVVTPDMHRVHHSIVPHETNSNFGFNLPWWDRLLGTYRAQPAAGHLGMTIGIGQFRNRKELRLDRMLIQPWLGEVGDYPINRPEAGARESPIADDRDEGRSLRAAVRKAYSAAAENPAGQHPFPVGMRFAQSLGYPEEYLSGLPAAAVEAFTGVSNVPIFAAIPPGSRVLDLGCGAGVDSLLAARRSGAGGTVVGVDFSAPMLERARKASAEAEVGNVVFCRADAERLPIKKGAIDVALVNGIFNLNPRRAAIFAELARVIRPGGELYAAELILREPTPAEIPSNEANWFA